MEKYLQSCKTEFWKKVFEAELHYILRELKGTKDILSVGCGPAIIETGLSEHGFNVTGLDISKEALGQAPDSIRAVAGSAENMDFADSSFDAAIYIASVQFIENIKKRLNRLPVSSDQVASFWLCYLIPNHSFLKKKPPIPPPT